MGFDERYRHHDAEDEEVASLAALHRVDVESAAELLARARREATLDDYRRTPREWFAMLVQRRAAREPVPGKRTAIHAALEGRRRRPDEELAPGRRTLTDAEARRRDQYREWKASEPRRLDDRVEQRMGGAFGFDFRGVVVHVDSPEARGTTRALTRDGEVHFPRERLPAGHARR
jgi:hypothetical protein